MQPDRCKYFTGTRDDECEKGVNYRKLVGGPDFRWVTKLPCLSKSKPPINCKDFLLPTKEEVEKREREIKESTANMLSAITLICEKHPEIQPEFEMSMDDQKKGLTGIIECPACEGELHYSVSGGNHHIWGKCKTEGCLSWMM